MCMESLCHLSNFSLLNFATFYAVLKQANVRDVYLIAEDQTEVNILRQLDSPCICLHTRWRS